MPRILLERLSSPENEFPSLAGTERILFSNKRYNIPTKPIKKPPISLPQTLSARESVQSR
jgi:hypothetical protein